MWMEQREGATGWGEDRRVMGPNCIGFCGPQQRVRSSSHKEDTESQRGEMTSSGSSIKIGGRTTKNCLQICLPKPTLPSPVDLP